MNNEIFEYNRNTHYLVEEDIISVHHEEIPYIKEKGYYETIAEYSNGGKDVKWIIDIPEQEYQAAYDEYETILRLTEFKKIELLDSDLMEELRHETEKTVNLNDSDRILALESEIIELKNIINTLMNKE